MHSRTSSSKLCGSHLRSVPSSTGSRMFPTHLVLPPSCVLCPPLPPTSVKTAGASFFLESGSTFVLSSVTFVWCCARASIASWNTGEETGSRYVRKTATVIDLNSLSCSAAIFVSKTTTFQGTRDRASSSSCSTGCPRLCSATLFLPAFCRGARGVTRCVLFYALPAPTRQCRS